MISWLVSIFRSRPRMGIPGSNAFPAVAKWNALGRDYVSRLNILIANSYEEGETLEADAIKDPRTSDQAKSIIKLVEAEERAGRWRADGPIADRAHEPFIDMLDGVCQNLNCVCILGIDELLVRLGTAYNPGPALHLLGGQVTERPDILAAAITRSHDLILIVTQEGFRVCHKLDGDPVVHFPWPDAVTPGALDIVQISEDGHTIAFVEHDKKVWLGQAGSVSPVWSCIYPSTAFLEATEDCSESDWQDSMMHCGLSPDGRFIAYGSQCYGHFIDRIDGVGDLSRWAKIGSRSEYPHYACFSNDGAFAALNSCHFYHGATVGIHTADIEGAETPAYEEHERTTLIDTRLRVYAATWLPLAPGKNGFALAGAGYLNIVSTDGDVRNTIYFGSSASSIDYCPKTGLLAVGSYSGFLHLYDPIQPAEEGTVIGYRPIREYYRWVLWRDRRAFRW